MFGTLWVGGCFVQGVFWGVAWRLWNFVLLVLSLGILVGSSKKAHSYPNSLLTLELDICFFVLVIMNIFIPIFFHMKYPYFI